MDNQLTSTELTTADNRAITHLKEAIASGEHWYIALLEAIGLWTGAEESYQGRHYRYLIDGEAFDWLLLAERLCREVESLLPEEERIALLFHGQPPVKLSADRFKKLIGGGKYHQYLNYFYGVTVEEALLRAVQEEVRKERRISGYSNEPNLLNEAYRRIYGATRAILLKRFRREKRHPQLKSASLAELKEFSYWLFKYRLKQCDKARVASDTKKALERLGANGSPR
ncbi:MAG: hypothetical protein A2Z76_03945, partial [Chloroflexi bacterium RBG_13_56_8b]